MPSPFFKTVPSLGLVLAILTLQGTHRSAEGADTFPSEVTAAASQTNGAVAVLGCGQGTGLAALAENGKLVVHALAKDETSLQAARATVMQAGKYGTVSVDRTLDFQSLPFPNNFLNLVICDADELGAQAPSEAELLRATAPGGTVFRKAGAWKKTVKPWPEKMDDWTHWDYDASWNAVSRDEMVQPATNLQWMTGVRDGSFGSPSNIGQSTGMRIANGVACNGVRLGKQGNRYIQCVDAFNGTFLWKQKVETINKLLLIVTPKRVFTLQGPGKKPGYLVSFDARSGANHRTYDQGIHFENNRFVHGGNSRSYVVVHDGLVIQADSTQLVVLDEESGAVKWKKTFTDNVAVPSVAPDLGLVAVANAGQRGGWGRNYILRNAKGVRAYSLQNGEEKWSYSIPSDLHKGLSQVVYHDGSYYAFAAADAMGHSKDASVRPIMARLDARTGNAVWERTYDGGKGPGGTTSARTLYLWNDMVVDAPNWRYHAYKPGDGSEIKTVEAGWARSHSQAGYGCEFQRATVNYQIISGGYVSRDDKVNRQFITRGTCATGFFPAHGMLYSDDGGCACWAQLRGTVAMSSDPVPAEVPNDKRLQKQGPSARPGAMPAQQAFTEPLRTGMIINDRYPAGDTVIGSYKIDVHRHTLSRVEGSSVKWHFTAGGRIGLQIVERDGKVYFGSHDGWVYCLAGSDGKFQWRFLAAAADQKYGNNSQLESRWPVMGLALHDGAICASAGVHPETGRGMLVWALDPASGSIRWRTQLWTNNQFLPAEQAYKAKRQTLLNGQLFSEDGVLRIKAYDGRGNRSFAIGQAEQDKILDPKTSLPTTQVIGGKRQLTYFSEHTMADLIEAGVPLYDVSGRRIQKGHKLFSNTKGFPVK